MRTRDTEHAEAQKMNIGDIVVKVRRVGPDAGEWVAGDATQMRWALLGDGQFEVLLKSEK